MLETSAFQIFYSGNSTFINSFDKTKFSWFISKPADSLIDWLLDWQSDQPSDFLVGLNMNQKSSVNISVTVLSIITDLTTFIFFILLFFYNNFTGVPASGTEQKSKVLWIFIIIRLKILIILLLQLVLHNYCKSVLLILLINIIVHQALDAKTRKGQMSAIDMFAVKASTSKPEKSSSKKENATQERKVEVRFLFYLFIFCGF